MSENATLTPTPTTDQEHLDRFREALQFVNPRLEGEEQTRWRQVAKEHGEALIEVGKRLGIDLLPHPIRKYLRTFNPRVRKDEVYPWLDELESRLAKAVPVATHPLRRAGLDATRPPLLNLPQHFTWAVGQVAGQGISDPDIHELIVALTKLGSALVSPACTLADATTPISARHALVMFRPALDTLAKYLTEKFSTYSSEGIAGEIQPPCNYPMGVQTGIMRLAENVRAFQEWDTRQPFGSLHDALSAQLVTSLESVLADLEAGQAGEQTSATEAMATHSADFTTVKWFGTVYQFAKGQQADSVRVLFEAWKNGTPSLSEKTIGEMIGSSNDQFRLEHTFKPTNKKTGKREAHPAWDTMIKSAGRGIFVLSPR
ncbi:MAG TPA: hypothetical protein VGZ25_14635 [Gemmataceae bacterium]|jgi:hypothetical protein|nr:hypothetical protein [Gemmataceae bacterium]